MDKNPKPISILHAFDPKKLLKHQYHDEVRFIWGRYLDIATQKGKDPRSLYFGTSKNSDLLTGIFLGDYELTSRIKDINLKSENNNIILTVKYIDNKGKLTTVKSKLPSTTKVDDLSTKINELENKINEIINDNTIIDRLNLIDSSIYIINNKLDNTNSSLNTLQNELENGKYNYTIHREVTSFKEGLQQVFTLYKGDNEQTDSSIIKVNDYVLKSLEYDDETNKIIANSWPDAIGDSIYETETIIDADGNEQVIRKDKLNDEYIKKTELNLDILEQHFINTVNTDSQVNDRLIFVENQLKWEKLIEN